MSSYTQICKDIKSIKIQGAYHIAQAGLEAYGKNPTAAALKELKSLRPNEPTLFNALDYAKTHSVKKAQEALTKGQAHVFVNGIPLVKEHVYTHCHSSTVMGILQMAKKKGVNITVHNTETRPLFQGRLTSKDLAKANIKNIHYVDSAMIDAITHSQVVLLGCDLVSEGVIYNKVGSGLACAVAKAEKIPVYICTHSWSYSPTALHLEERSPKEVWDKAPKSVKVENVAFDAIPFDYIDGIVSELGVLKPKAFIKKVKKVYPWVNR